MPNLFTTTTRRLYEAFYGVRTKDTEFDIKVEEMKGCEKSFQSIKNIFSNFLGSTKGIKIMCKDVYSSLTLAYSDTSPYYNFIVETTQIFQEVERLYDSLAEFISILANQTVEWDRIFEDSKKNVALREQFRMTYDHYDEKLEKLVKARNDKAQRNQNETQKEIEKFDRNDAKFKKATDEYIKQSQYTYQLICELLDYRYKLINPHVTKYLIEQQKFFAAVNDLFRKFDGLSNKFQNMERQIKKSGNNYDPTKYVRGYALLQGVNISQLPHLQNDQKKSEKYSYEDYLRSKGGQGGQGGGQVGGQAGGQGGGQFRQIGRIDQQTSTIPTEDGKFSYEAYKINKNQNPSLNQQNDFNKYNNNYSSDFNKNSSTNDYLNFNINNSEDMRKTTIIPQSDFTLFNNDQHADTFNPYSSLSFDDFKPNNMNNNMNNNLNSKMNSTLINNSTQGLNNNRSQFPNNQGIFNNSTQMNFPTMGGNQTSNNNSIPNVNYNNMNSNTSNMNNLSFPKNSDSTLKFPKK